MAESMPSSTASLGSSHAARDGSSPAASDGSSPAASAASAVAQTRSWGQRLKGWIDTLLVIDVFVVIVGALWFGVAVLCHSRGIEEPLSAFQALWEPLFTPAIGLLMAAALLSGVLGWCLRWWQRRAPR